MPVDRHEPVARLAARPAAGKFFSTWSTTRVVSCGPIAAKKTNSSTNASTRFTSGPAAITTIRFQTGWAW